MDSVWDGVTEYLMAELFIMNKGLNFLVWPILFKKKDENPGIRADVISQGEVVRKNCLHA